MRILKPLPGTLPRPVHNIVGDWLMNSLGDNVFDLSGNGNTFGFGFGAAAPLWVAGKYGHAIRCDGNDNLNRSTITNDFSQGSIVVSALCDNWADGVQRYIVSFYNDAENYVQLLKTNSNNLLGRYEGSNIFDQTYSSSASFIGTYNIILTWNSKELKLYVNGNQIGTTAINLGSFVGFPATNLIGSIWLGNIEYVYLFNWALSASEIARLYRESFYRYPENRIFAVA